MNAVSFVLTTFLWTFKTLLTDNNKILIKMIHFNPKYNEY